MEFNRYIIKHLKKHSKLFKKSLKQQSEMVLSEANMFDWSATDPKFEPVWTLEDQYNLMEIEEDYPTDETIWLTKIIQNINFIFFNKFIEQLENQKQPLVLGGWTDIKKEIDLFEERVREDIHKTFKPWRSFGLKEFKQKMKVLNERWNIDLDKDSILMFLTYDKVKHNHIVSVNIINHI